jgi:hypothetical protein
MADDNSLAWILSCNIAIVIEIFSDVLLNAGSIIA